MIEIIAICGKSSSGKTTLIKELKSILKLQANVVKSYTTREQRTYDPEDINSHIFVSEEFYNQNKNKAIAMYDSPKGYHSWIDEESFCNGINLYAIDPKAVVTELLPYCKMRNWKLDVFYLNVSDKERKRRYKKREGNLDGYSEENHLNSDILKDIDTNCYVVDADTEDTNGLAKCVLSLTVKEDIEQ